MWTVIGKLALQAGMWCLKNPQQIEASIVAIHELIDEIHSASKK